MRFVPSAAVVLRGAALFAGVFLVVGLVAWWRGPGPDPTHWLLGARGLPAAVRAPLLLAVAAGALAWATAPRSRLARALAPVTFAVAAVVAAADGVTALAVAAEGALRLRVPPASFAVAAVMGCAAWRARAPAPARPPAVAVSAGAWAVLFAVAQMACFGTSDYRRPADAVVVFGARVHADGRPSVAVADRVRTAARLVVDGLAPVLVVSGGPGDGAFHETDVMRRIAEAEGVPPAAIVEDRDGLDTRATARNAARLLLPRGAGSVLVVSHAYHLPRVKCAFEREGLRAYCVPADESRVMAALPWYVAREVAAWWVYWWRDGFVAQR